MASRNYRLARYFNEQTVLLRQIEAHRRPPVPIRKGRKAQVWHPRTAPSGALARRRADQRSPERPTRSTRTFRRPAHRKVFAPQARIRACE
ncbi:hypothetical protein Plo01_46000 [Planobispora longispora]|uniref:Uncharacterized protein n=1 Tax=Planobispora longispora TaxID=28887 RepID=A0A8J3RQ53_9ACTN|nr:hypothetical protein GCM10020093_021090 [Planobispora longispora]GIH78171.1 hypothetical protein Plo01_46000 [Planobispora longispora]